MKKNLNDIDKMLDSVEDVSSMQDHTGLIPRGPENDFEYENYMNLLKFSAKNITQNNQNAD